MALMFGHANALCIGVFISYRMLEVNSVNSISLMILY